MGLALLLAPLACRFPYSFSGGGLDRSIRTIAILPFENKTTAPELSQELFEQMRRDLRRQLGLRDAPEASAHAIAKGVIQQYDPDMTVGVTTDPTRLASRHRLQLTIDVQIIQQKDGKVIFERKGMNATADYSEQGEGEARRKAIETIVRDIVEGAQSQW